MEAWNFFRLLVCITPYFYYLQAIVSSGYVGCFKDNVFRKGIWSAKEVFNNGARCIRICSASGHIFAATQYRYCICGTTLRGNPKQVNCQYKCPRYQKEICGGPNRMSVYDIRSAVQTTVRSTTPNSSMKIKSEIASMSTEQVDHDTVTAAVQTTIRSTTPNRSMKITSEVASMSAEQVDHDTGRRTDDLVSVHISVPVLITVAVAISVAINVVIIFCLRRKRRKRRKSYRNSPRATMAHSDDYLNASLSTNLQHLTVATDDNYSYALIPNTHFDHRVANVDNLYLNESLQSNLSHPVAPNTDSNYANDLLHGISIVSTAEHEYVDINYEELLSQREDNHCYGQLKT